MNKRWRVLLCIVFVSVLSWLLWQVWPDREPIYKEKPLSYWLKGFDIGYNRADKPSSDESVEAVRQSGTNALPILLHMLRARDSDLTHTLSRFASKYLIWMNYVTADRQRWAAREGFGALGLYAKPAIPELVQISQEEASRAEWHKYATEILELLKQAWPKEVSAYVATPPPKTGRSK